MSYSTKIQSFVYDKSPYFVKNIISSYYGWATFAKKYGQFYRTYFDNLVSTQYLTTQELLYLQEKEALKFIRYAYSNVQYYRKLFKNADLGLSDIRCLDDIHKIPILTKEMVRQKLDILISEEFRNKDLIWLHTSGTTGKALRIAITEECFQQGYALHWFHRSWGRIDRKTDRVATFAGHPVVPTEQMRPPFWVHNLYEKQLLFSSYHLCKRNLPYYVEKLERFQPDFIHGYPSSIYLIAIYLLDHRIGTIRPKCVVTSSETLFDHQRKAIEAAFGCRLLTYYGCAERAAEILECPEGNLHLEHRRSYVEFLDENNNPVAPGYPGRMVCTAFSNYAMPLIRYEVGDIAIPAYHECKCGRGGLIVEKVVGRTDDYIITPAGRFVGRLGHIFHNALNVQEAQLVQETLDRLIIRIVRRSDYSEEDEKSILNEAYRRLGENIEIEVDYVDRIPRTSSGKLKFIVSKIDLGKYRLPEALR